MYSGAFGLLNELKIEIKVLREQISTMQKMLDEQTANVGSNLAPRISLASNDLEIEIQKERKENAKLEYEVNELTGDNNNGVYAMLFVIFIIRSLSQQVISLRPRLSPRAPSS